MFCVHSCSGAGPGGGIRGGLALPHLGGVFEGAGRDRYWRRRWESAGIVRERRLPRARRKVGIERVWFEWSLPSPRPPSLDFVLWFQALPLRHSCCLPACLHPAKSYPLPRWEGLRSQTKPPSRCSHLQRPSLFRPNLNLGFFTFFIIILAYDEYVCLP